MKKTFLTIVTILFLTTGVAQAKKGDVYEVEGTVYAFVLNPNGIDSEIHHLRFQDDIVIEHQFIEEIARSEGGVLFRTISVNDSRKWFIPPMHTIFSMSEKELKTHLTTRIIKKREMRTHIKNVTRELYDFEKSKHAIEGLLKAN